MESLPFSYIQISSIAILLLSLLLALISNLKRDKNNLKAKYESLLQEERERGDGERQRLIREHAKELDEVVNDAQRRIAYERERAEERIRDVRREAEERVREEREAMRAERDQLHGLSDKDLLVEAVHGLATYASRLDRIEGLIRENECSNQVLLFKNEMTQQIDDVSEISCDIARTLNNMENNLNSLCSTLGILSGYVTKLSNRIGEEGDYDSLYGKIEDIESSINELKYILNNIN